jgi:hypothetical protein
LGEVMPRAATRKVAYPFFFAMNFVDFPIGLRQ